MQILIFTNADTTAVVALPLSPSKRSRPNNPVASLSGSDGPSSWPLTTHPITANPSVPLISPVYQHVCSLAGVTSSLSRRPAVQSDDNEFIVSLGAKANKYLVAHGYTISAMHHIDHACTSSHSLQDFIGYLHPRGMVWTEIVYIWDLINADVA